MLALYDIGVDTPHRTMNQQRYVSLYGQVLVVELEEQAVTESDVLVMATDGLWDVISNQRAAELVEQSLEAFPADDVSTRRYRWARRYRGAEIVFCFGARVQNQRKCG